MVILKGLGLLIHTYVIAYVCISRLLSVVSHHSDCSYISAVNLTLLTFSNSSVAPHSIVLFIDLIIDNAVFFLYLNVAPNLNCES